MLGPVQLALDESFLSDNDGTTARTYYFDIPFAALARTLFIEFNLRSLSANGSVEFEIEDSVTGEVWESTDQGWGAATAAGTKVLRTSNAFGTKARLRLKVSGSSGTSAKVAVLRIAVSGKPF